MRNNDNRFMGATVIGRNTGSQEENYYGFNLATTSQSAFLNDNVFAGRFYIDAAITEESANTFIQNLRWFTNYQMQRAEGKRSPVFIHINTPGGMITQGWAIINAIRACPLETIGFVQGNCFSMGLPILLACNTRISYEYSELMIHQLAGWNGGKLEDMKLSLARQEKMQERLETFMLANSDMTEEFLTEIREKKEDYFFYPEEALELGIIDEIIGDIDEYNQKKMEEMMEQMSGGGCGDGECTCNTPNPQTNRKTKGKDDGVVITDEDDDDDLKIEIVEDSEEETTELTDEEKKALRKRRKKLRSKLKKQRAKFDDAEAGSEESDEIDERIKEIEAKIEAIEADLAK